MNQPKFDERYEHFDLDNFVPVTFFFIDKNSDLENRSPKKCKHLGYLVKDGVNKDSPASTQRLKCSNCGKRFGTGVNEFKLGEYHYKIKQILYDLFIDGSKQNKMEERWLIPQPKLSQFKRSFVEQTFDQFPDLVLDRPKDLPLGTMYADETFIGKKGNSNTEIVFCSENFEILSTEGVKTPDLKKPITVAFNKISEKNRKRLRILVTDGEPTYCGIALGSNRRVIHVQQYHKRSLLGQVTFNKYRSFGPHTLRYQIHTHWKVFKEEKQEFCFHWEIKFIKGKFQAGRGRPTKAQRKSKEYRQWRQKKDEYYSNTFQKSGKARVFVNLETKKVSMKKGCKIWMQRIFQRLLPLFAGKCITNNRVESKHSQIKRCGNLRKQLDIDYCDKLFLLQEYLTIHKHLPPVNLKGRPLYKYLMKPNKKRHKGYAKIENGKKKTQSLISSFL